MPETAFARTGKTLYARLIEEILEEWGRTGKYDPLHVEAWIRVQHTGALDHLSREDFEAEIAIACSCIDAAGKKDSEKLARSILPAFLYGK